MGKGCGCGTSNLAIPLEDNEATQAGLAAAAAAGKEAAAASGNNAVSEAAVQKPGKKASVVVVAKTYHNKARSKERYDMRIDVDDDHVPWEVDMTDYAPPDFTTDQVLEQNREVKEGGYADPPDFFSRPEFEDRLTFEVKLKDGEGRPRNPHGRTGLRGRGVLGKWGANQAADPIVVRNHPDNGLQVILIKRKDNGEWAIPGGMVDDGEVASQSLKREFAEEAASLKTEEDKNRLDAIFQEGPSRSVLFKGYVDDPRNTDNAWMETTMCMFAASEGQAGLLRFELQDGETTAIEWASFAGLGKRKLFASHASLLEIAHEAAKTYFKNNIHTKSRSKERYSVRIDVPDDKVAWKEDFPEYAPPDHTLEVVLKNARDVKDKGWADPADFYKEAAFRENKLSYEVKSYCDDGRPRNPRGRTGIRGRGLLGKWGANQAADPIVVRNHKSDGLQVILIKRADTGEMAIPGGMVDDGEVASATLKREFAEEAARLDKQEDKDRLDAIFSDGSHRQTLYHGYVDDSRNTDNAWMETTACMFACTERQAKLLRFEVQEGETTAISWVSLKDLDTVPLFASHLNLLTIARAAAANYYA